MKAAASSWSEKCCLWGFKEPGSIHTHRTQQTQSQQAGLESSSGVLCKQLILWDTILWPPRNSTAVQCVLEVLLGRTELRPSAGSELMRLSGQILTWSDSGISIYITSSAGWSTHVIWVSQWLTRTGVLDKKPLLVIRRNYIFCRGQNN